MTIRTSSRPVAAASILVAILVALFALPFSAALGQGAGVEVDQPPIPRGIDVFNLDLRQTRAFSRSLNFKVVGHSYLKGPHLAPAAKAEGTGAGINNLRVHDAIAYLAGYNDPPTLFGQLIVDVRDPKDMKVLSYVPCNPGTRCPYLRVNTKRHILVGTHDSNEDNPNQPRGGPSKAKVGVSFTDVSRPENPQPLGFFLTEVGGATHGFEIDDNFVYTCASMAESKQPKAGNQELVIIDYRNPTNPTLAARLHLPGQHVGEEFSDRDEFNLDGSPRRVWCHEITMHKNRLYVAWRDAGLVVVDVTDPTQPKLIGQLDYVAPFNGGALGAAHTSAPVIVDPNKHPDLVVQTDEIFSCPPGFGRIIDVSDLKNPKVEAGLRKPNFQVISSYRLPHISDVFDFEEGKFVCPAGQQSTHTPWFDHRSPSLLYQAWYDQGVRVWDISNPFLPREIGFYLSPEYASFGHVDRHTREVFQDPDTDLIYVTDGNGGGLTVLEWTGPIPKHPPIPGAR
jgi:hypothetical protein